LCRALSVIATLRTERAALAMHLPRLISVSTSLSHIAITNDPVIVGAQSSSLSFAADLSTQIALARHDTPRRPRYPPPPFRTLFLPRYHLSSVFLSLSPSPSLSLSLSLPAIDRLRLAFLSRARSSSPPARHYMRHCTSSFLSEAPLPSPSLFLSLNA